MLLLLGDELIRDSGLAVFELVKNAYDADASECTVTMEAIDDPASGRIVIEDNGVGMDWATVTGVWLEPGTDFRRQQRHKKSRSPKYKRVPLGEKGVGRFAVHKLGRQIEVVTRRRGEPEIVIQIDWAQFDTHKYLEDVPVALIRRAPEVFREHLSGTRITVSALREHWTRAKVRALYRSITSICSPFDKPTDFSATLDLRPDPSWLEGLEDVATILSQSLYRAYARLSSGSLEYRYEFRPLPGMRDTIKGRKVGPTRCSLQSPFRKRDPVNLDQFAIGPLSLHLRIFDREPLVLDLTTGDKAGLKKFLNQNGGIRVYRDGVRVFDFGEPGNDWLDLGGRRVNIPTVRISNNQVIGAVMLSSTSSTDLVEKTNREGFIENDAYEALREAILFAVTQIEAERKIDKKRLRQVYSRASTRTPVLDDLEELRDALTRRNLLKDFGNYINRVERQFLEVRDTLLTAAGAGLSLTTVLHEVEKIIKELCHSVRSGAARSRITQLAEHLEQLVDGLAFLVRKSGKGTETASVLIKQTLFNNEFRLRAHGIDATNGLDLGDPDFSVQCTRRLIVQTMSNLIDNSIYWLENKGQARKRVYLGTTYEMSGRPALLVADNGPGFRDPPEYLVEPFFTRRPDGMGLGLHLASEVAKLHEGRLLFPERDEVTLPEGFSGAIVALEFRREK